MSLYPRNANHLSTGTLVKIRDIDEITFFALCLGPQVFLGPDGKLYTDMESSEKLQSLMEDGIAKIIE